MAFLLGVRDFRLDDGFIRGGVLRAVGVVNCFQLLDGVLQGSAVGLAIWQCDSNDEYYLIGCD